MAAAATGLNLLGAATALLAAVFWFMSARNRLPQMVTYWGYTPKEDPFYQAVQRGNRLNRTAAGFAAASALCAAVVAILPLLTDSS